MDMQKDVEAFHEKFGFKIDQNLEAEDHPNSASWCYWISQQLKHKLIPPIEEGAKNYSREKDDERLYRMYLILEEAMELAEALSERNEVLAADAIADLLYVVVGAAVTFNIPIPECWKEVQKSNMSKARTDHRMRDKGPDYKPADFVKAINDGRLRRSMEQR